MLFFVLFVRLGSPSDIETLKKLNRDFLNSIVNKDTATLSTILADDFILINPGGAKRNKADNLSSVFTPNQKVVSVDIDSVEVRLLSGEVGLVTAWTNNKMLSEADKENNKFKICYQDVETLKRKINRDALPRLNLSTQINRDTATLSSILADDFILINPGGAKRNKADNLSSVFTPNQKVVSVDIDSVEVRLLSGEVGLVTAWTNNKMEADNKETKFRICYQDVYVKRKNKWVAVAAHVSFLGSN